MRSIGLLGGSFDPVHHGHLIVGRVAAESLGLDVLRFVPAREQPFKQGRHAAPPADRAAMLDLAVAGEPGFAVERVELDRPGPSYTADTLLALRAREPEADLTLLLGADAAAELGAWHRAAELPGLARIAVLRAAGCAGTRLSPDCGRRDGSRDRDLGHGDPPPGPGRAVDPLLGTRRRGRVRGPAPFIFGPRMIKNLMTAVFGTRFDRERRRIQPTIDAIHAEEARLTDLSADELKAQTLLFRERLAERTGAVKAELEQVREAKHGCADPEERERLEQRFHELETAYKKALAEALDEHPARRRSPPCGRPAAG